MPAYLVVAIINLPGTSGHEPQIIDHVVAADIATAQQKVTTAAPDYLAKFPAGTTASVGLIQADIVFTVSS